MLPLTASFSLIVAAAGWYYMFYSRAAARLGAVEEHRENRIRQRLRRLNGAAMFLMAVLFFAGFNSIDFRNSPNAFVGVWFGVFVLLLAIVVLAMIDVRLTWRLRRRRQQREE
ncbi:MAG TPA: hypothetical protein VEA69_02550 [Tepidisphaeraceae bacterium]|nr:hypothetical protein [Tepidisphaeraceae bacterium]